MIELPRAALTAHRIADAADFFSFGTNDLTQTTWGFSRDDVEAAIFAAYLEKGVFTVSPFESIDADGVGRLVRDRGRGGPADEAGLKLGVCGEHGGDPDSIEFFHERRARLRLLLALPGAGRPARGRPRRRRLGAGRHPVGARPGCPGFGGPGSQVAGGVRGRSRLPSAPGVACALPISVNASDMSAALTECGSAVWSPLAGRRRRSGFW